MRVQNFYIIIVAILIFLNQGCSVEEAEVKQIANVDGFNIIFWPLELTSMEELQKSTIEQLLSKYIPIQILNDKDILHYYWDEQFIEVEKDKLYFSDAISIMPKTGLFTIVLNNEVAYDGLNKIQGVLESRSYKYDDSNYPAIIEQLCADNSKYILALKPHYGIPFFIFRDYDEKEQQKLLRPKVLHYFEKQGKIIRGKMDLKGLLKSYHNFYIDGNMLRKRNNDTDKQGKK